MKAGLKIGLIIGGATLLIGGTIFAVVKMTKKDDEKIGGGQPNANWLKSYLSEGELKSFYDTAWWYANKAEDKTNPIGRALWDLVNNKKLTSEQSAEIKGKGITFEELEMAYKGE